MRQGDWSDPQFCLAAVKENSWNIKYVIKQTPEICLTAVKQCGWTIKYVEEQTPELCMIAVQQFGWTIDYIENQTPELCVAALKQDVKAAKYIRLPANKTQQIEFLDKLYNLLKEEGLSTGVLRTIKESQK